MPYSVRNKETGEEKVLQESQVNDMVVNGNGEIIVFDTAEDMQAYYLLDENGNIAKKEDYLDE